MQTGTTIGIIGAYGVIGKIVTAELAKSVDCELLIGGRNNEKIQALCNSIAAKATGMVVDVYNNDSLRQFCGACTLIVNCAGPSLKIKDRVIRIAVACGCDYVDPGIWFDKNDEYADLFIENGLTGMLYAGWIPGISGLLPRYLYEKHAGGFDTISSLNVYLGDRSVWSENAMFDALYHFVRDVQPGLFRNGKWVSKSGLFAITGSKIYEHPGNIGKYLVTPVDATELQAFAAETGIPEIGCYAGIAGLSTILKVMYIRYLHVGDDAAVKILTNAFAQESAKYGTGGAVSCILRGTKDGRSCQQTVAVYEKDTVWLTSIATVAAVRLLVRNTVKIKGLGFFCDMVASDAFFELLESYGVLCDWSGGLKN